MKYKISFIYFLFIFISGDIYSQDIDSTKTVLRKNTIRWNLTPSLIIGPKSIVLGYERIVNNHQSFSINIGYLEKKPATNKDGEALNLFDESKSNGFVISGDYRFYFKKRNIKPAPDGLYWGPYAGYYKLGFKGKSKIFNIDGVESTVGVNSNLQLFSVGAQLGYQFVLFNDRFSIDLILMGPSLTRYIFDLELDAGVALDPDSEYYNDVKDILNFIIPGSGIILDGQEFSEHGKLGFNSIGFRYGVQIGFRF